jgi:NitT/TauT family transport system ATP-binding protein
VRQDTKMPSEARDFAARPRSPAAATRVGVSLCSLEHAYGELRTIDRLDLSVPADGVVGLVGPSGCGKSTLLELIAGLQEPTGGEVEVAGARDPAGRLAHCAFMPQRDLLLPWLSAIDNAALALRNRGTRRREARREAARLFERFGLAGFESAAPAELSGGMRQRVAFLRTLLAGKPVLALDEPFASLDAITRAEMQAWLAAALDKDPRTVVLVTHDVEEALYLSDRIAVLSARPMRVVEELSAPAPRAVDRDGAVTDGAFVAIRERAMRALRGGSA